VHARFLLQIAGLMLSVKPKIWLTATLALGAMAALFLYVSRKSGPAEMPRAGVRIAVPVFQSSALVLLADELGYFREEGVDATFEYRATGKLCLDLVLQGKADLAVVYETPVMHAALEGNRLSILTELHRSESNTAVVSRRDRGIQRAADLVGKTVAAVPKTNADFLLRLFLRSNLIDPRAVMIKAMSAADAVSAVRTGNVDAAALWEPYLSQAIAVEPDNYSLLRSPYYSEFSMLVGKRDAIHESQPAPYAVLRALKRAADFYAEDTVKAQRLVDNLLKKQGVFVSAQAWNQIDIHLGISATLLAMLTEEAHSFRSRETLHTNEEVTALMRGQFLKSLDPQLVTYE
jgi:ABC-type nitrate/sulfonate/bicarbonate transport system substrate-binding protein